MKDKIESCLKCCGVMQDVRILGDGERLLCKVCHVPNQRYFCNICERGYCWDHLLSNHQRPRWKKKSITFNWLAFSAFSRSSTVSVNSFFIKNFSSLLLSIWRKKNNSKEFQEVAYLFHFFHDFLFNISFWTRCTRLCFAKIGYIIYLLG